MLSNFEMLKQSQDADHLDKRFQSALAFHESGHPDQAAAIYEKVLEDFPNHAGAWHLPGVACHQRGDFVRAAENISRAIALDCSNAACHNNLGNALLAERRHLKWPFMLGHNRISPKSLLRNLARQAAEELSTEETRSPQEKGALYAMLVTFRQGPI